MTHPKPTDFAALGIAVPADASGEVRTTCPQCSASRRKSRDRCLAVNLDEGIFLCWHCDWKGSVSGGASAGSPRVPREPATPDERKRAKLQDVWRAASPLLPGDPPMTYLAQRGLILPANAIPPVLRYHPQLPYAPDDDTQPWTAHPAMLARIDDPEGHPVSVHRTYLTPTGHKADVLHVRKSMAPAVPGASTGAAIRLYRPTEVLAVTEGLETAIAVHLSTGLPAWAAICARGMAKLVVPATVQMVVICADHDANGVGAQAADALAQRLVAEGRRVKILLPERVGADWLDVYAAPQGSHLTRGRIEATPDVRLHPPEEEQSPPEPPDAPAIVHHKLPDYIRNHPDPRVRKHWERIYRRTAILKERYAREGGLLCPK